MCTRLRRAYQCSDFVEATSGDLLLVCTSKTTICEQSAMATFECKRYRIYKLEIDSNEQLIVYNPIQNLGSDCVVLGDNKISNNCAAVLVLA